MLENTRQRRPGWVIMAILIGLSAIRSDAAPQIDEDGPGTVNPPTCNREGTKLPNGRTYRVQGRIQQDCVRTPYGAILNLPRYKVEVLVGWKVEKKCPSLPTFVSPTAIGSVTTGNTGQYSYSITGAGLNSIAPEHYDILGVTVGIRLREPGTDTIVGRTTFVTWSSATTAIRNHTITDDCPADRLNEPLAAEPVWRLQLRLFTSNASNADTEDQVNARLNPRNDTWMDYARDDFERNDDFTYDLLPLEVGQRSDINRIIITKEGTDFWAIRRLQLLVNEVPMYDETFPGQGLWLNSASGFSPSYTVDYYKLRNNPAWLAWEPPSLTEALLIPHDDLVKRLEGLLGHLAHLGGAEMEGEHLYGDAVELEQVDSQTLAVDFDLTVPRNNADDAEIDIDFHVRFSCDENEPPIELQNLHIDISAFGDFLSDEDEFAEGKLRLQITQNFEKFVNRLFDGNETGRCPCVDEVIDDGGLRLFGSRPCPVIDDGDGPTPPNHGGLIGQVNGVLTAGGSGGTANPTLGTAVIGGATTATRR